MDYAENESENWRMWCRLCTKEDGHGNISIFLKDEQSKNSHGHNETDFNLVTTIEKYFGVKIIIADELPVMLCPACFSLITVLVNFSERVCKVQQFYKRLHEKVTMNVKLDLQTMRQQYGLLDEERDRLPEWPYYDTKPTFNGLDTEFIAETGSTQRQQIKKEALPENSKVAEQSQYYIEDDNEVEEEFEDDQQGITENEEDPFNGTGAGYNCSDDEVKSEEEKTNTDSENSQDPSAKMKKETDTDATEKNHQRPTRKRRKRKSSEEVESPEPCNETAKCEVATSAKSVGRKKGHGSREGNSHTCIECARHFKAFHHLRQHMKRAHSRELPTPKLRCPECPRTFAAQHLLAWHARKHLPAELKKVIPCTHCAKKFSTNWMVQAHVKCVHMDERQFVCEECGITTRTAAALKSHMLTHTDYAPYICEVCQKSFKNERRLKTHKETHDPSKHICAECGLQLNSRATLNRHLLVHSDECKHKCDYCGRAFKRAKALKSHLILHTGLKPYACDFCERTFANGSNCRTHKKKSHPAELAAQEATGGRKTHTPNIPKLEALKAVTKAANNLTPVVSKQSGCFSFGKKVKLRTVVKTPDTASDKALPLPTTSDLLNAVDLLGESNTTIPTIPTIDNIYSHIMKQAGRAPPTSDSNPAVSLAESTHFYPEHRSQQQPLLEQPVDMDVLRSPQSDVSIVGTASHLTAGSSASAEIVDNSAVPTHFYNMRQQLQAPYL